uniref:Uncharacterized protein n=1 Tax=Tanacetum cinerariifolium TaxID=118510 RepID=A0A6L2MDJ6_TANCI|nr:hypothetical protein [Tanacetum cinerariifolium]
MNTTQAQQKALNDTLVALVDRLEFGKCNMRLKTDIKPKEATFQVGMFYKKIIDYLYLLWEDFLFQIENKEAKKTNKMSYPRFTKIIIDYFLSKDLSISRRNKMFWHTDRDDTMFTSIRCISIHDKTQVYGTILPKELTNQATLQSKAYKTYYAFASGEKTPNQSTFERKLILEHHPRRRLFKLLKSKVLDEQHLKTTGAYKGTGTIPGVPDVPIYEYKKEEEKIYDEETMDEEDYDEVTKELYDDVNMNLGNEDTEMTNIDQGASEQQNASQQSGFKQEEEDAHVTLTPVLDIQNTRANNEIASLIDTTSHHTTAIIEITSNFITPTLPPRLFFNPLSQQATPTPTPTASETTTSLLELPDFAYVFKFNERVSNLEKDLSEMKQVDRYAKSLSSIPAIMNCYIDNKLREAINKAIQAYNFDYREEDQAKKKEFIEIVDSTVKVATPVIEKNVTESLEAAILRRSSSQPQSSYKAAATLFEFEFTKILIDKMQNDK